MTQINLSSSSPSSHGNADSETSWSDAAASHHTKPELNHGPAHSQAQMRELFDQNILAKAFKVGLDGLDTVESPHGTSRSPREFPETVAQVGPKAGQCEFREPDFWTCGFFPGVLCALLERSIKFPQSLQLGQSWTPQNIRPHLQSLCSTWSEPLHPMSNRTDTHDLGFIIMPALQRDWELTGNQKSLDSIIQAARGLATRYNPTAKAIRSWDALLKKEIQVTDMNDNFLLIIDSMCNLELLYYAASHSGDTSLADMATAHARTLLDTHLRPEFAHAYPSRMYTGQLYSTCHVANIDPNTGVLKWRWTAQGYCNDSTWSRGQAWAILGYAQTYMWTKDRAFLDAACGVAEYFLYRLETSPSCVEIPVDDQRGETRPKGRYVPLWDWDAPIDSNNPLRDSSAGTIAANGMLILSQALRGVGQHRLSEHFLDIALKIIQDTIDLSLAPETMKLTVSGNEVATEEVTLGQRFDGILKNGTANNNEHARRRYADHGLVYADYYFVEFGNRLLNMGLV